MKRPVAVLATAGLIACMGSNCKAENVQNPNAGWQRPKHIHLLAHGTSPRQRVRIEWRNSSQRTFQQIVGMRWEKTVSVSRDATVIFRLRNYAATGEVKCTADLEGFAVSTDHGDTTATCSYTNR
jgi:hypothetical protein